MSGYDKTLDTWDNAVNIFTRDDGKISMEFECYHETVGIDLMREDALKIAAMLTEAAEGAKDGV